MNLIFFALPFLFISVLAVTNLNWRQLVKIVLFLVIIDGALRKWILPQASNLIYLLKDVILICAYLKFFIFTYKKYPLITNKYISIAHIFFALASTWLFFQSFNPDLGSPIIGIFGLSRYILYVPLMWLIPYLFDSEKDFYQFVRNYLLCLIPVCVLGIFQFYSPPSSFINIAPGGAEAAEALQFGDSKIRISSTFAFNNIYTSYLVVCFGFLLPFIIEQKKTHFVWKALTFLELFLMIANLFMTGSRGVIVYCSLILLGYLGVKSFDNWATIVKSLRKFAIPAVIVMIILPIWFAPAIDAFSSRKTTSKEFSERFGATVYIQSDSSSKSFFDGYGTGATQSGNQALRNIFSLPAGLNPPPAESEIYRVTLEIGLVGLILWYGMRISLLVALWFVYRKLQSPYLKDMALIALLIHLQLLPGQVVVHPVANVYYWFLSGFIFLLPCLEIKNIYDNQCLSMFTAHREAIDKQN
ncbi:O-antigen ligase family protein [Chlorogloeopsis fritschii PCC 9212]|uniref:O-antigen polymerase n=1 Tax=Chlorogloeopsis fritschii PCC 6912 TaxID=211165 RepID=A0A433NRB9_CHLFR|nr:hypothetical protein [Chlorogloeopsis fritschii]RUR86797.1 hypothetical protein PCC6912_02400 [Chlorogloeopsis fritschii PCC 6912]